MILLGDLEERLAEASKVLISCPALSEAELLTDQEFFDLLIQRRFVSLAFTPFYDALIDALDDRATLLVCRHVLREEYPGKGGNTPSHRELLVTDLIALGVDRRQLRTARPSPATAQAIIDSFELVPAASREAHSGIAVTTTAACYAESLVAAEYRALKPRLEKQLRIEDTVFYGPHLLHDDGHAKRLLDQVRIAMIKKPGQMDTFDAAVERCLRVKVDFYNQFGGPSAARM